MGRNIPSITYRIESKLKEWERFISLLPAQDRLAFQKLIPQIKNRRTAIDASDEELSLAMLLAIAAHLKAEILSLDSNGQAGEKGEGEKDEAQSRLD